MITKRTCLLATPFLIVSAFACVFSMGLGRASALSTATQTGKVEFSITEPKDGSAVPERPYVAGNIGNPSADVWVVVHPLEVADYWVQPRLTVRPDGTWKVISYIGRPGNVDVGKHFEIMAFANPKQPLKEGDMLRYWPEAALKSQLVEVIRK